MSDPTLRTRIVEGIGVLDRLGDLASELGGRALLVTDPGLVAAGHVDRAEASLRAAGVAFERFADVRHDPTTEDVERCLAVARAYGPDLLIGLGGGSAIDTAKGTNFLLSCGGEMKDYWGVGKATADMLPLIAVPTTAGTGTEGQSFALIADAKTHQKMACGDARAAAKVALLDPELTVTVPPFVTACTGLDAIVHAVETAVTRKRNAVSRELSFEAFRRAYAAFPRVLDAPNDVDARAEMQHAAMLAGRAIENSMLGAAHACANPLTATYDLPHGQAVGAMIPHVVRFNARDPEIAELYAVLAASAGIDGGARELADALEGMVARAGMTGALARLVDEERVDALAAAAAAQWTAGFNPVEVDAAALAGLYRDALSVTA